MCPSFVYVSLKNYRIPNYFEVVNCEEYKNVLIFFSLYSFFWNLYSFTHVWNFNEMYHLDVHIMIYLIVVSIPVLYLPVVCEWLKKILSSLFCHCQK